MLSKRRSGLGSLIPGADLPAAGDGAPLMVPTSQIAVNPYQPRHHFDEDALEELTDSVRMYGILQPLVVRPREGGYELIAGERRLTAARHAGLGEVPVVVREANDEDMLALALIENLMREDLNPIEEAHSYQQLIKKFGLSQTEIASRLGKSRPAVVNTLRLLTLPEEIQSALLSGAISEGHGRALLTTTDTAQRQALLRETILEGLSVRELEQKISAKPAGKTAAKKKAAPAAKQHKNSAAIEAVLTDLQQVYGTKVRLRPGSDYDKGAFEIEYYSYDDLLRIIELLME